jgi:hypothetical protein
VAPDALLALCLVLAPVSAAAAREADQNDAAAAIQQGTGAPDFLFGAPRGSIALRAGWVFASARSDLFEFVQRQLTIDDGDFDAPAFAMDVGVAVSPRIDAVFGFEFSRARVASEYRDFVDNNRQPITQETELREINLSGSVRVALTPRGRSVGRLAWVPRRATPYAGAGGGALWYRFAQQGDFIDVFSPRRAVFTDRLTSDGWTPSAHAFAGVDVLLYRALSASIEGRYLWGSAKLERSFEGFDPIDLTGFRLAAGINILF